MTMTYCTVDFEIMERRKANKLHEDLEHFKMLAESRQAANIEKAQEIVRLNIALADKARQIDELQSDASHVASEMKQLREQRNKALDAQVIANARAVDAERKLAGQGMDWPFPGAMLQEWVCRPLPQPAPRYPFEPLLPEFEVTAKFRWNGKKD